MEIQKKKKKKYPIEFRKSIIVETSLPIKGTTIHRIAAYRLSDISRNMGYLNEGYEFDNAKLVSRTSEAEDEILEDGDVISVRVQRRTQE